METPRPPPQDAHRSRLALSQQLRDPATLPSPRGSRTIPLGAPPPSWPPRLTTASPASSDTGTALPSPRMDPALDLRFACSTAHKPPRVTIRHVQTQTPAPLPDPPSPTLSSTRQMESGFAAVPVLLPSGSHPRPVPSQGDTAGTHPMAAAGPQPSGPSPLDHGSLSRQGPQPLRGRQDSPGLRALNGPHSDVPPCWPHLGSRGSSLAPPQPRFGEDTEDGCLHRRWRRAHEGEAT